MICPVGNQISQLLLTIKLSGRGEGYISTRLYSDYIEENVLIIRGCCPMPMGSQTVEFCHFLLLGCQEE